MGLFDLVVDYFTSSEPEPVRITLGRNEACWCGSGRKYKKCHLVEDERRARASAGSLNCVKN